MTLLRRFRVLAAVPTLSAIALAMTPLSSTAQSSPQAPPQIIASGVGEATIIPDRGMIYLSVETRAPTAAGAGAEIDDSHRMLDRELGHHGRRDGRA